MTYRAESIMDAMQTALTSLSTTGTNVKRTRVYNFGEDVTDALTIMMGSEEVISADENPFGQVYVNLNVIVEAHTMNASPDQQLNQIKNEVIAALMASPRYGLSYVFWTYQQGWDEPVMTAGDKPIASCVGNFIIRYKRSESAGDSD